MSSEASSTGTRRVSAVPLYDSPPPTAKPEPASGFTEQATVTIVNGGDGFPSRPPPEPSTLAVVVAAFTGLGYALSARALLLLSIIGTFVLAVMAVDQPTALRLWTVVVFAVLVVLPMVYLEVGKRR